MRTLWLFCWLLLSILTAFGQGDSLSRSEPICLDSLKKTYNTNDHFRAWIDTSEAATWAEAQAQESVGNFLPIDSIFENRLGEAERSVVVWVHGMVQNPGADTAHWFFWESNWAGYM
ncbi:MAG: hypothetical protein AAF206_19560, partial [Bacteroidota bacterium]